MSIAIFWLPRVTRNPEDKVKNIYPLEISSCRKIHIWCTSLVLGSIHSSTLRKCVFSSPCNCFLFLSTTPQITVKESYFHTLSLTHTNLRTKTTATARTPKNASFPLPTQPFKNGLLIIKILPPPKVRVRNARRLRTTPRSRRVLHCHVSQRATEAHHQWPSGL